MAGGDRHPDTHYVHPSAVTIGLVYILLPFMVMPLYSSIEKLDRPLLEAAKDLGASKLQTFIRIIIPLTMPGIIAGCLLVMLRRWGCSTFPT